MKVAIPYEDGQIFQHFGKTTGFKIYDIDNQNKEIAGSEVVPTDSSGHGYMSQFLKDHGVSAVVCGGIGQKAVLALQEAGIDVYSGAAGSTDTAAQSLLHGELVKNEGEPCAEKDHAGGCCH